MNYNSEPMTKKKLYRSNKDVIASGVISGIAEYFNHDSALWRLAFVGFLILTGLMPGILLYLIAYLVIPVEPVATYRDVTN